MGSSIVPVRSVSPELETMFLRVIAVSVVLESFLDLAVWPETTAVRLPISANAAVAVRVKPRAQHSFGGSEQRLCFWFTKLRKIIDVQPAVNAKPDAVITNHLLPSDRAGRSDSNPVESATHRVDLADKF